VCAIYVLLAAASNGKAAIVVGMYITFLWGEHEIQKELIKLRQPPVDSKELPSIDCIKIPSNKNMRKPIGTQKLRYP